MRRLAVLLAATSCGSSAHRARPPARTPYLMLFEQGKTFTLPSTQKTSAGGAPFRATATCTVVEVKQVGDASVSRLACTSPFESLLINGTWVAAPEGLYHPYLPVDDPDELTLLGEDQLLIGALPKERNHRHADGMTLEVIDTFDENGSGCVRQATSAGTTARAFALCFDGTTVTGASDLVRNGTEWQRVDLGAAPQDDDVDESTETE